MSKVLGVPTPYKVHLYPWPTRFRGPIYTRPVFSFPVIAQTADVIIPSQEQLNGLGAWDTGRGIFKPQVRGGGIFDGNISGLGDDASQYPWGQVSEATKKLQETTNVALNAAGYCPLTVDGKLGPATCGARDRLTIETNAIFKNPDTCQGQTIPKKKSEGCGGKAPPPGAPLTPMSPAPATPMMMSAGMTGSTKRALAFLAGGVAVVGAVYFLKKRMKR